MNKKISTRTAYGEALAEIGSDPRIFVLDADLQCCTRTEKFGALYPERSRNVGIAEANMVGIAAGMAACGKIVFVNSFAMFTAGRAFEQIRNSLAYPHLMSRSSAPMPASASVRTAPPTSALRIWRLCAPSPAWWCSLPATPMRPG